ncbi:RGS domain-containing protein [Tricharina praecox]|uniref:RGS domain-containing protein n=1 Tax=Tricharina praecox TaxID=43433 RepID=UPI002220D53B|nr:RGS domain-containing protein [Tricharina praecox]KAI5857220.1 RGS domain-containing protein [Tricharina praecox]
MTGRSRSRRPPSLDLSMSSRGSSRSGSPEPESDDETSQQESCCETIDDRPREGERIFPSGPYCFKQPTLADVLSDKAPPPYSLTAFMAYLSQNHCLETLEFTMDASRYRKHYSSIACPKDRQSAPSQKDCATVRKLWQRLLDAYVVPNAPREVNLPCNIRDQILSVPNHRTPPPPEALEPAVKIVHELMQESVLVPFLSDCQQHHNTFVSESSCPTSWGGNASDESLYMRGSLDDRMLRCRRDNSPPSPVDCMSNSYPTIAPPRIPRTTSPFSAALGWHHHSRQSSSHQPTSSWASNASGDSMTMIEDSGSSTTSWGSPMTPPTTPPASEMTRGHSPRSSVDKAEKGWKRVTGGLGRGLGWGRKKPEHGSYW